MYIRIRYNRKSLQSFYNNFTGNVEKTALRYIRENPISLFVIYNYGPVSFDQFIKKTYILGHFFRRQNISKYTITSVTIIRTQRYAELIELSYISLLHMRVYAFFEIR